MHSADFYFFEKHTFVRFEGVKRVILMEGSKEVDRNGLNFWGSS